MKEPYFYFARMLAARSAARRAASAAMVAASLTFADARPVMTSLSANSHPRAAEFQAFLDEVVGLGLPGSVMLVRDSAGTWMGALGWADFQAKVAMTVATRLRIASISKSFAATALLRIAEEGRIHLDSAISTYLPPGNLRGIANGRSATVRQALNHTSGIFAYNQSMAYGAFILNNPHANQWTPDRCLGFARNRNAYFPPGTRFHYSNTNYVLAGALLEAVTGKDRFEAMREIILAPLGLDRTLFSLENPVPEDIAAGYADLFADGRALETTRFAFGFQTLDGGMVSDAADLADFLESVLAGGFVPPRLLGEATDWVEVPENDPEFDRGFTGYGLGFRRWATPFGEAVGHSGETFGYLSFAFRFPASGATFVWLCNASYGKADEIVEAALKRVPGLLHARAQTSEKSDVP